VGSRASYRGRSRSLLKDEPPTALIVVVSIPEKSAVVCRLLEVADIAAHANGVMPPHRQCDDGRVAYPALVHAPGDVLLWFRSKPV
jgi:hypothetical protein